MTVAVAAGAATLDDVKARGTLNCGVTTGLAGFAAPDDQGNWKGLDVDMCRAVAAAIFGDDTKVNFVPTNAKERFTALQSGEIDLLARNTPWTLSPATAPGFHLPGGNHYHGQGSLGPQGPRRQP